MGTTGSHQCHQCHQRQGRRLARRMVVEEGKGDLVSFGSPSSCPASVVQNTVYLYFPPLSLRVFLFWRRTNPSFLASRRFDLVQDAHYLILQTFCVTCLSLYPKALSSYH